ncbi:MAG: hypothetical protein WB814_05450, partial [Candidatus Sulfotelmatobacter sp.]
SIVDGVFLGCSMQQQFLDFRTAFVEPTSKQRKPDDPDNKKTEADKMIVAPILDGRRQGLLVT